MREIFLVCCVGSAALVAVGLVLPACQGSSCADVHDPSCFGGGADASDIDSPSSDEAIIVERDVASQTDADADAAGNACGDACAGPASGHGQATCPPDASCGISCDTGYHGCIGDCLPDTGAPQSDSCVSADSFGSFASPNGDDGSPATRAVQRTKNGHARDAA